MRAGARLDLRQNYRKVDSLVERRSEPSEESWWVLGRVAYKSPLLQPFDRIEQQRMYVASYPCASRKDDASIRLRNAGDFEWPCGFIGTLPHSLQRNALEGTLWYSIGHLI
jgi:hypothetical protein